MFSHLSRPLPRTLFLPFFLNAIVVGRMGPKDTQFLIPETCGYDTLHSKRSYADVIKVMEPKIGKIILDSRWAQSKHMSPWKQNFLELESEIFGRRRSQRDLKCERNSTCCCCRETTWKPWERMKVASRSKDWPLADSKQGNGDLSPTTARNWIWQSTWMSLEVNSIPEPQNGM